jgi:hypothetical protein
MKESLTLVPSEEKEVGFGNSAAVWALSTGAPVETMGTGGFVSAFEAGVAVGAFVMAVGAFATGAWLLLLEIVRNLWDGMSFWNQCGSGGFWGGGRCFWKAQSWQGSQQ